MVGANTMKTFIVILSLLLAAVILMYALSPSHYPNGDGQTYMQELVIEDVLVGQGQEEVKPGDTVSVHYTGMFSSGEVFDSSRERGIPLSFVVGVGEVIPGWDEGLLGMRVGGQRKLVVPASLGYGETGYPPNIPPGATLLFDIELLDIQPHEQNES